MSRKHIPMAIIYDFDGTLAPGNMQEHQFLPEIGMKPTEFWGEVKQLSRSHQADEVLVYMDLMLKKARSAGSPIRRQDFEKRGRSIDLFEGVLDWFDRVSEFGRAEGVRIGHYLVSSGNDEIVAGTPIATKFAKIYASKFIFDENGVATWPALAVNYTTKTQFLFRINKDAHDLSDNSKVNEYIEKHQRPIPFENMIFIGDGSTDIPCFRLVKEQGGLSIAVFPPRKKDGRKKADGYLESGRVHCVVPAAYGPDGEIEQIVKAQIKLVAARAVMDRLLADKRTRQTVARKQSTTQGSSDSVDLVTVDHPS